MIVVADTSVILNLCRIQHEQLLQQLFKRVLIPVQVADEFNRLAKARRQFSGAVLPAWVEILTAPQSFPPQVAQAELDLGESAAIALCLSQNADALLIDETIGREVAARLGLRTVGVLGVLLNARNEKLIANVKELLDRLEMEANFWISSEVRSEVLKLAGE